MQSEIKNIAKQSQLQYQSLEKCIENNFKQMSKLIYNELTNIRSTIETSLNNLNKNEPSPSLTREDLFAEPPEKITSLEQFYNAEKKFSSSSQQDITDKKRMVTYYYKNFKVHNSILKTHHTLLDRFL